MIPKPPFIDALASQAGKILGGEKTQLHQDIESQLKGLLQSAFSKLELVTREEFEDQLAVLRHTRAMVESLQEQVAALEAKLEEVQPQEAEAEPKALPASEEPVEEKPKKKSKK